MHEILELSFWNNTVYHYLVVLGIILVGIILIKVIRGPVLKRVKKLTEKTSSRIDDFIVASLGRFGIPALYVLLISTSIHYLNLNPRLSSLITTLTIIIITILVIRLISATILMLLTNYVRQQSGGEEKVKQLYGVMVIINVFIWTVGVLFLLDNLGRDVTTIIASLGIGGIAIALAAQNIVGDVFNYFVIFFDKPFEVGDFVVIDDKNGVIEYVGLKTTRIKTLSGEQLVLSNSDVTKSRIQNFKKMQRRRIVFKLAVPYQTTYSQLKEIPQLIAAIIQEQKPTTFDRAHFFSYGESSLIYEVVYYVESGDYNLYMDIQQSINLRIYKDFDSRDIQIAYPTRTIHIDRGGHDDRDNEDPPTLVVEDGQNA